MLQPGVQVPERKEPVLLALLPQELPASWLLPSF